MPRKPKIPSYRLHKPSNQAVVRLDGHDNYLGKHDSPESHAEYERLISEWLASGRHLTPKTSDLTVEEVMAAYWKHAENYYRKPSGEPTSEIRDIRDSLKPLRKLYGDTTASSFGPLKLKAVRESMIAGDLSRKVTNQRIGRIKRMFKWAVENELIPASVHHALQTVPGLKRGRSAARETKPVRPVPPEHVEAILPLLLPPVQAMIQLQLLTGMRPGEVVMMRKCDVTKSGSVWTYVPESHKTEWRGHSRTIYLGPQAQDIVREWIEIATTEYLI